jgi:hypothetical protein
MPQIFLDISVTNQLSKFDGPVEICDPLGKVVGRFVPRIEMYEWEQVPPDISSEELLRRSKSTEKRYTTAEVIAHLEKL